MNDKRDYHASPNWNAYNTRTNGLALQKQITTKDVNRWGESKNSLKLEIHQLNRLFLMTHLPPTSLTLIERAGMKAEATNNRVRVALQDAMLAAAFTDGKLLAYATQPTG